MNNEINEVEMLPLYDAIMILPYVENPYLKMETEEGFKYDGGNFENPDSGNIDKKDMPIHIGRVIAVGHKCEFIKEGDEVFYDRRSVRVLPFYDNGFCILSERAVLAVINEGLTKRKEELLNK